jgi:AcrR family transcriptional regulator
MGAGASTRERGSLDNRKARGFGHERPAEILAAARALFLERGVEEVTTRQIAARVGISQTALYVYFETKDQMLERLADLAWGALAEALDEAGAVEGAEACPVVSLRAILVAFMRFWLDHPDDYRIVFLRRALKPCVEAAHVLAPGETLLARLTGSIEAGKAKGAMRCLGSPQATALSVWAAMSGMIGLRLRYPDFPWPPVAEHVEAMAELILHGCAAGHVAAARS